MRCLTVSRFLCLFPFSDFGAEPDNGAVSSMSRARQTAKRVVLVIHGGAGVLSEQEMTTEGLIRRDFEHSLAQALSAGYTALQQKDGASVDAVEAAVCMMENSTLFNAGRGAAFNSDGRVELDAAIMEGKMDGKAEGKEDPRKRAGAVAALKHIKNPISAARAIMEMQGGRNVLLVGEEAERFFLGQPKSPGEETNALSSGRPAETDASWLTGCPMFRGGLSNRRPPEDSSN